MKEKKLVRQALDDLHISKPRREKALTRAEADMAGGYPDRNGELLGVMTSDISDVTSQLALGPKDEIEHRKDLFNWHLKEAARHLRAAKTDMFSLIGLSHEEARRIVEEQSKTSTKCLNCEIIVTGTRGDPEKGIADDRLKKGRCQSCYDFLKNNGVDREPEKERGAKKRFGTITPDGKLVEK